jgi:biopolymer transport protein ExbB
MLFNLLAQIVETGSENAEQMNAQAPTEETISIWQLYVEGGMYIMLPLTLFSILAVYIYIERFLAIQKASKPDPNFMNRIKDAIVKGNIDEALKECKLNDNPRSRMIEKGISRIGKPLGDISASIENVGKLEIYKLEKSLSTLATIAGSAPMIGFLGTVIGMIVTFHEMKISGNGVEISALSGGIMQAMVTTVAGLIVGIIAYMGYNLLVAKVEKVVFDLEATTVEFMDLLQEPA